MAAVDLDAVPCTVQRSNGGTYPKARALIYRGRFVVLDESSGAVRLEVDTTVTEYVPARFAHEPATVHTPEGTYTVKSGGDCGCHSRLKGIRVADYFREVAQ